MSVPKHKAIKLKLLGDSLVTLGRGGSAKVIVWFLSGDFVEDNTVSQRYKTDHASCPQASEMFLTVS